MRRLVVVTAIPVLGAIAGVIVNALIPQPYQSTAVVHLDRAASAPGLRFARQKATPRICMPIASWAGMTSSRCGASSSPA